MDYADIVDFLNENSLPSSISDSSSFPPNYFPSYASLNHFMQQLSVLLGEASLEAYGLESLPGSEGSVNVSEDIQEICKGYKLGADIPFTATYNGKFDRAAQASLKGAEEASSAEDVEAVAESN